MAWINATFIRSQAVSAWNSAKKRINHDGLEDDDGPIHLIGFKLEFRPPNTVVTIVHGFDTSPWPDVDFTMSIADIFSIDNDIVRVESNSDLETDVPFFVDVFTGMLAFLGAVLNPLFYIPAAALTAQRLIIVVADPPGPESGAGGIAAGRIPRDVYIEGGIKLVALYSRVQVDAGGIIAAGGAIPAPREPTCRIVGPSQVVAQSGATSVARTFTALTDDLRGTLKYEWSGDGTAAGKRGNSVSFRFDLSDMTAGEADQKQIRLRVTDEDGLTAEHSVRVTVFKGAAGSEDLPPICRIRPWLPQCQPE